MGAIAADDPLFTLAAFAALRPGDDPPDFLALLTARPAWHADAACRGRGTAVFFAGSTDTAKQVCDGCPVVAKCADAGQGERHGVWGGLSAQERREPASEKGAKRARELAKQRETVNTAE